MSIRQPTAGASSTPTSQAAPPLAGSTGSPASGAKESGAVEVRLRGRRLALARLGWVVVVLARRI